MPTLHVRNVPDRLYSRVRKLAAVESRSLSAEVIVLLERAMAQQQAQEEQAQLLEDIRRHRFRPATDVPPSEDLIREDRER
jgi:plasmid stability protein